MKRFLKLHKKKAIFIVSLLIFISWMIWGNATFEVSHFTISNEKIPKAFDDYKIAHISDLHNKDWGEALVTPIREEKPDIIVITGDIIDSNRTNITVATEFVRQIKDIAPIYFVTGNHEAKTEQYPTLRENLLDLDVNILDNETVVLNKNGDQILLVGLLDPSFYFENGLLDEPELKMGSKLKELTEGYDGYNILLSHRPEYFDSYLENDMDLVLSGHAHGGQIRIPFMGGLVAPGQGFFPKYTSGLYEEQGTDMIVSRGLGNSIFPVRFNNRAELVFINLDDGGS